MTRLVQCTKSEHHGHHAEGVACAYCEPAQVAMVENATNLGDGKFKTGDMVTYRGLHAKVGCELLLLPSDYLIRLENSGAWLIASGCQLTKVDQ